MAAPEIMIVPVTTKAERGAFVDLAYRLNAADPNWVPPLRMEAMELVTPGKNPFFEHATVQYFLARRGGEVVGRISAHYDHLALAMSADNSPARPRMNCRTVATKLKPNQTSR